MDFRIWLTGAFIILLWVVLGMWSDRIVTSNGVEAAIHLLIRLLPVASGFVIAYFTSRHAAINALSMILLASVIGPAANFVMGKLGFDVDFPGLSGMGPTAALFLASSAFGVIPGVAIGLFLKKLG